MDSRKKAPEQFFNGTEMKIIKDYFSGASIRKLADSYEGYGRTKIKNIIQRYVDEFPEQEAEVKNMLKANKYHKKEGESVELPELTDEQIAQAYDDIQNNGITLTAVAKSLGRTKDYIRKRVLEYINSEEEEKEFVDTLKSNQHKKRRDDFLGMSEQEKKDYIFTKLNRRRELNDRPPYDLPFLEKKYARLRRYMLEIRNENVPENARLSEDDFFKILYDTPTLLSSSLRNRVVPALENLDYHKDIGMENASKIIKDDASILCSSIQRTNLQIRILSDNNLLHIFLNKPRSFRTSPELMYGLIEFHKKGKGKNENLDESQIFITKTKLQNKYGMNPEDLTRKYNVQDEYGDDEYFK